MSDDARLLEIQRKAFEEQFGSLESMGFQDKTKNGTDEESSEEEAKEDVADELEESDYYVSEQSDEELSEYQEVPKIKTKKARVIKFNGPSDEYIPPSKKEQKFLKSGKSLIRNKQPTAKQEKEEVSDEDEEQENLKNDIELQRFLKESHLLSALGQDNGIDAGSNEDSLVGKARSRTLEMRLKGLSTINGSEKKLGKLEKMPIQIRKGMVDKHLKRIKKHEAEAKEGGIVLSAVKRGSFRKIDKTYRNDIERRIGTSIKKKQALFGKRRQRGLKVQSIGKSTRNGLIISRDEIDRINKQGNNQGNNHRGKRRG